MNWNIRIAFACLAIVIGFATIPRVFVGYGMDGDAWRSVKAADRFVQTGDYIPSRFPGNPLFEYSLAAIHPWAGNVGTNSLVLLLFALSIYFFFKVAEILRPDNAFLLTCIYALVPILVKNAAITMDYIPGLCMLLGSCYFALKGRVALAGLFLGLAVGFRSTNALFLAPLVLYLYLRGFNLRRIAGLATIAALVGLAFYIPILLKFGLRTVSTLPIMYSPGLYAVRTAYQGIELFGVIPSLVLIIAVLNRRRISGFFKNSAGRMRDAGFYLEIATVAAFALLFIYRSDETEYLIPCIPFCLLLLDRLFSRKQVLVLGLVIVTYSLFDIELKGGSSGAREFKPRLTSGVIVRDFTDRLELSQLRNEIYRLRSPVKTVVLTGMEPIVTYQNSYLEEVPYTQVLPSLEERGIDDPTNCQRIRNSSTYFLNSVSRENALSLLAHGYRLIAFSENAPSMLVNKYHYSPDDLHMETVAIAGDRAFWR